MRAKYIIHINPEYPEIQSKYIEELGKEITTSKGVISLKNDRGTSYKMYIAVQNELVAAYNFLRDRESQRLYGWKFTEVKRAIDEGNFSGNISSTEEKLKNVQELFPLLLMKPLRQRLKETLVQKYFAKDVQAKFSDQGLVK